MHPPRRARSGISSQRPDRSKPPEYNCGPRSKKVTLNSRISNHFSFSGYSERVAAFDVAVVPPPTASLYQDGSAPDLRSADRRPTLPACQDATCSSTSGPAARSSAQEECCTSGFRCHCGTWKTCCTNEAEKSAMRPCGSGGNASGRTVPQKPAASALNGCAHARLHCYHFNQEHSLSSGDIFRRNRAAALAEWCGLCAAQGKATLPWRDQLESV